jgi:hypothetical protein
MKNEELYIVPACPKPAADGLFPQDVSTEQDKKPVPPFTDYLLLRKQQKNRYNIILYKVSTVQSPGGRVLVIMNYEL